MPCCWSSQSFARILRRRPPESTDAVAVRHVAPMQVVSTGIAARSQRWGWTPPSSGLRQDSEQHLRSCRLYPGAALVGDSAETSATWSVGRRRHSCRTRRRGPRGPSRPVRSSQADRTGQRARVRRADGRDERSWPSTKIGQHAVGPRRQRRRRSCRPSQSYPCGGSSPAEASTDACSSDSYDVGGRRIRELIAATVAGRTRSHRVLRPRDPSRIGTVSSPFANTARSAVRASVGRQTLDRRLGWLRSGQRPSRCPRLTGTTAVAAANPWGGMLP